jgi:hypothetical protein
VPERTKDETAERLKRIIDELGSERNDAYPALAAMGRDARDLLHELIASSIEAPLNKHLASLPQDSLPEKKELAKWLNSELRTLGLALKCPRTGKPSYLRAGDHYIAATGRFAICLTSDRQRRRTLSSNTLFPIKLMPFPDRFRHESEPRPKSWTDRASGGKGEGRNRS